VLALLVARLYGVPFVYWLSFPFPEASLQEVRDGKARYPILYRVRAFILRVLLYQAILPGADLVFVQSEKMKEDLAKEGIDPNKMTPVPMGVDLRDMPDISEIDPCRARREGPLLAYLGTLSALRHLDMLVRVLALVRKSHPEAYLILVGDGDLPTDRSIIEDEAARCGLTEAVQITGFLPREEALRLVSSADVCLSPFYPSMVLASTSPTKLVEYMALGRPVVASEHPEQRLVVDASHCGICVRWDEEAFASAICEIVEDPKEAHSMGERGRAYVLSERTYAKIADHVESQYVNLVAETSRHGTAESGR